MWSAPEARILGRRVREAQAGSDLLDGLLRPLWAMDQLVWGNVVANDPPTAPPTVMATIPGVT